jgi:hypothetical protein
MLYVLFGVSLVLLIALSATAAYFIFQKKEEKEFPTIHASGIFSLVRQSPREALNERRLTVEQVREALENAANPGLVNAPAEKYLKLWEEMMELSINTIEKGDMEGLQTYSYKIPDKDLESCRGLTGSIYVTREQLQNFANLIPPFHLGCQAALIPKQAHQTNLDGTGWKPLLPVAGKYPTPDWRTVGKIQSS